MKSKKKAKIMLLVLGLIFVLSVISNTKLSYDQGNQVSNESDLNMTSDGLHSSNGDVVIYEDQNYGGASQILTVGSYDIEDLTIGNDKLSSLQVPEGFKVTLFEYSHFTGDFMIVTSDTPDVGTFNDKTSSIIVELIIPPTSPIIYEDQNYGGASQILTVGSYDIEDLTIGNDKLSSLQVPEGFKVTLFEYSHFTGDFMIVTSDTPDVGTFNDKTSSIIVELIIPSIKIITPENKTYTEPMSGYYPATWGFENDEIGIAPEGWVDVSGSGCSVEVIEELDNHKNVVELDDPSEIRRSTLYRSFSGHFYGTVEFYMRATSVGWYSEVSLSSGSTHLFRVLFGSHYLRAYNNTDLINFLSVNPHQWYHVHIDFRCQGAVEYMGLKEKEFKIYVDGQEYGPYIIFDNSDLGVNKMNIRTGIGQYNYRLYVDSIGFSWDPEYNIGDNLEEGLLLSFENNTNLDWIGYSLDGQDNITILGNTTIPILENGPHTIQVFGNDSLGRDCQSQIRHFIIDILEPISTVISPGDDDDDDDDEEEIEFLGPTLIIIGSTSAIGVAGIALYLSRKKRLKLKK